MTKKSNGLGMFEIRGVSFAALIGDGDVGAAKA
jgi:hypothetical protein